MGMILQTCQNNIQLHSLKKNIPMDEIEQIISLKCTRKLNFFKEENGSPDVPLPLFETANEVQHHHSTSRHVNFL